MENTELTLATEKNPFTVKIEQMALMLAKLTIALSAKTHRTALKLNGAMRFQLPVGLMKCSRSGECSLGAGADEEAIFGCKGSPKHGEGQRGLQGGQGRKQLRDKILLPATLGLPNPGEPGCRGEGRTNRQNDASASP